MLHEKNKLSQICMQIVGQPVKTKKAMYGVVTKCELVVWSLISWPLILADCMTRNLWVGSVSTVVNSNFCSTSKYFYWLLYCSSYSHGPTVHCNSLWLYRKLQRDTGEREGLVAIQKIIQGTGEWVDHCETTQRLKILIDGMIVWVTWVNREWI